MSWRDRATVVNPSKGGWKSRAVVVSTEDQNTDKSTMANDLAQKAVSGVNATLHAEEPEAAPKRSLIQRGIDFAKSHLDFVPRNMEEAKQSVKRFAAPMLGTFGPARFAQSVGMAGKEEAKANFRKQGGVLGKTGEIVADATVLSPQDAALALGADVLGGAIGKGIQLAAKPVVKTVAKAGSILSGVKPSSYARLIDDPAAILPSKLGGPKPIKEAGEAIGESIQKAGLPSGGFNPLGNPGGVVDDLWNKAIKGVPEVTEETLPKVVNNLLPEERLVMLRNLNEVMSQAVPGKNKVLMRQRTMLKEALKDAIERDIPGYAKGTKEYARAALRGDFAKAFPVSKYGEQSVGRLLFGGTPLYAAGNAIGGPAVGAVTGALGVSPAVHGAATALAGAGLKMTPVGGMLGFREILRRSRERNKKK